MTKCCNTKLFTRETDSGCALAWNSRRRFAAFTLAEVLITLGVIGVVAAMTMPILINEYKESVLKTQIKHAFSTISQAYKLAVIDLEYDPACYYYTQARGTECVSWSESSVADGEPLECLERRYIDNGELVGSNSSSINKVTDCQYLGPAFRKRLTITKTCEPGHASECLSEDFHGIDKVHLDNDTSNDDDTTKEQRAREKSNDCIGFTTSNILNRSYAYVLAGGQVIIMYGYEGWQNYPIFAVDVNGKKTPNKWGHDIFLFNLKSDGYKPFEVVPAGDNTNCSPTEKGGKTAREIIYGRR